MFLFLTECSNRSPGVGIPGWHGVLELTTQLAKSLSPELLLQPMVHIYMHQYTICSFSFFFLLPKQEGGPETLERIKLGRCHYSEKPHYLNPAVRLIYTKVISSVLKERWSIGPSRGLGNSDSKGWRNQRTQQHKLISNFCLWNQNALGEYFSKAFISFMQQPNNKFCNV